MMTWYLVITSSSPFLVAMIRAGHSSFKKKWVWFQTCSPTSGDTSVKLWDSLPFVYTTSWTCIIFTQKRSGYRSLCHSYSDPPPFASITNCLCWRGNSWNLSAPRRGSPDILNKNRTGRTLSVYSSWLQGFVTLDYPNCECAAWRYDKRVTTISDYPPPH